MNHSLDIRLYKSIQSCVKRARITRRLVDFRIDREDAVHQIWIRLSKYSRQKQIRDFDRYASYYVPKLIQQLVDRAARHNRHHNIQEID